MTEKTFLITMAISILAIWIYDKLIKKINDNE